MTLNPTRQPDGLDEVVDRMDAQLAVLAERNDRRTVFLSVYRTMTAATIDAIRDQRFMDPPWMVAMTKRFAGYYYDAQDAWEAGQHCPEAWRVAFEVSRRRRVSPVEHALLGINAHIVHDLPLAVAMTMRGEGDVANGEIAAGIAARRRHDYEVINHVLAETVDLAQEVLGKSSRASAWADAIALRADEYAAEAMLRAARTQGWHVAVALAVARNHGEEAAVLAHLERIALGYVARIDLMSLVPTRTGRALARRIRPAFAPDPGVRAARSASGGR